MNIIQVNWPAMPANLLLENKTPLKAFCSVQVNYVVNVEESYKNTMINTDY